jgi:hypothetical protein
MRTTIRIDEQLLKEAKQMAARSGKSLTAVIEDALRESISRQKMSGQSEGPARLVTFNGKGIQPGVDLDDSASLVDLMEFSNDLD